MALSVLTENQMTDTKDPGFLSETFRALIPSIDQSGMREVITSDGFDVMTKIEYLQDAIWRQGALAGIGENVNYPDGRSITAYMVVGQDDKCFLRTRGEIRHTPENGLPELWADAMRKGWRIMRTSCMCGGSYGWFKPCSSGAFESAGCVCHNDPKL